MAQTFTLHSLWSYTDELARAAQTEDGLPERLARHAHEITARNLSHLGSGALDATSRRRVRAYFRAVVRRLAARSNAPGACEYRLRVMAASIAADLRESGADGDRVAREVSAWLESHWGAA
ncbi:MAG: hypothetical protein IBX63_07415 [Coriobacteriia bacterium]|nr:hypothetical protein [Coriobacteriia bacterium]